MGATYTRQSSSNIVDGNVIEAADLNNEFNQLLAAFEASTGHTHDGTANEGGAISKLLSNTLTFGAATAGTDITITFDGETSDGVMKWMEDEDYFEFSDDLLIASTEKLQFRDTAIYINSSTDGQLDLVADSEIQIAATTIDINGNVDISGSLTFGGAASFASDVSFGDNNITNVGSIALDTITADGTDVTVDSGGDIILDADGADITLKDGGTTFGSLTNSSGELVIKSGSTPTAAITLSGANTTVEGNLTVDGNFDVTGTLDFSDSAITNVGSIQLDSIAGDADSNTSITFSGSDVITMATGGTSALTIDASQNVTIAGDLTVSGDDITMGTNTAGNLLVADGTNFNSIAVSSLSEISTVANDDVFLAIDTSGGGLKKIARSAVVSGLATSSALSNVVEDTTPQLGGNLDLNGNDIVTTSNADLELAPNGTGHVTIKGNTNQGTIQFNCESNSHGQQIKAAPHSESANNVLTLPSTGGDSRLVSATSTATLTNKTLTTPVIAEIDSGSSITLDATTDIILDADGADVILKDGGTTFGSFTNSSGELVIKSGSTPTAAVTLSGANATIEGNLTVDGNFDVTGTLDFSDSSITNIGSIALDTITNDGTDITLDSSGDIILDADGGDFNFKDGGTEILRITNSSSDVIIRPVVDAKDLIFQQRDGTEVARIEDNGTFNVVTNKLAINGTAITSTAAELNILDGVTSTAAELNILDGVTSTATELNIMDGDTAASSVTLVDADRLVTNDAGTMKQVALTTLKTYLTSAGFSTEDPTALAIALG